MFLFGKQKRKDSSSAKPIFLCQPFLSASLVKGNFKKLVILPRYLDLNEWLAANSTFCCFSLKAFEFFNYTNLFYGAISEYCTQKECPMMHAGVQSEYLWIDSQKRSVKISAPQYADYVMSWIQNLVNDESVFPTKAGKFLQETKDTRTDGEFPKDFHATVKQIFRQLFRILAHIYHAHYEKILHMSAEAHLNTLTAHLLAFVKEFDLIEKRELVPLQDLIDEFEAAQWI